MKSTILMSLLFSLPGLLFAEVSVTDAWVRSTISSQSATGAFMKLTSKGDAKLVSVSCDVIGMVEIHEMKMEGETMKMREVKSISLPDGKTVSLKPGGYHVMLMGLKEPVKVDQVLTFKLVFEKSDGTTETQEVKAKAYPISETPFSAAGDEKCDC